LLLSLLLACFEKPKEEKIVIEQKTITSFATNINEQQKETAMTIENSLKMMEIPDNIIAAAIVNGVAESELDADAVGDNGKAYGIFQLHNSGLGSKMSPHYRKNIHINSSVVGIEILKNENLIKQDQKGVCIGKLTQIITKDIMRPDDVNYQMQLRNKLAQVIFPERI
jgi:hypothetical protein